jgi:hypothetical protein
MSTCFSFDRPAIDWRAASLTVVFSSRILVELSANWPHWPGYASLICHLLATARAP